MGVLQCSRNGCENVMCDRYSPMYGYICEECFKELLSSGAPLTQESITIFLSIHKTFMAWPSIEDRRIKLETIFPGN